MAKSRIQILGLIAIAAVAVVLVANMHAQVWHQRSARNASDQAPKVAASKMAHPCSIATIAGEWVFITDVLYTQAGTVDGIAIGTINIGIDGPTAARMTGRGLAEPPSATTISEP